MARLSSVEAGEVSADMSSGLGGLSCDSRRVISRVDLMGSPMGFTGLRKRRLSIRLLISLI